MSPPFPHLDADRPFIERILADPNNPTLRLIYADWLEANGNPRAAHIRRFCRWEQLLELEPHFDEIESGMDVFCQAYSADFSLRVQRKLGRRPDWELELLDYGGPLSICCDWETLATHADVFFTVEPAIAHFEPARELNLHQAQAMISSGWLRSMLLFDSYQHSHAATQAILSSPSSCESFRHLILHGKVFREAGMAELLTQSEHLANVRALHIDPLFGADQVVAAIASSPYLSGLKYLCLAGNDLTAKGLRNLASSVKLAGVQRLDISKIGRTAHQAPGVRALSQSEHVGNLEDLKMRGICSTGLRHLSRSSHLSRVRRLDLREGGVTNSAIKSFVKSPMAHGLERLNLSGNPIGDEGLRHLCEAEQLSSLKQLQLNRCDLTANGLACLQDCSFRSQLEWLELSHNQLGSAGGQALGNQEWPSLRRLDCEACKIQVRGAQAIASSAMPRLTYLDLGGNPIRVSGAKAIAKAANGDLPLRYFAYHPRHVPAEVQRELRRVVKTVEQRI